MHILITGGTGFLGSHLAGKLSDKHTLFLLSRKPSDNRYLKYLELKHFDLICCDLTNRKALAKSFPSHVDLVLHCAGEINIAPDFRCPEGLAETNLAGTINLIEAMIDKDAKKLIFASSMTTYAAYNKPPVKEFSLLAPLHFYGLTKKWAEEAILKYASLGFIKALIIRYPGLFGYPRANGYIYNVASRFLKNEEVRVDSTGLKFWEAINIEDACQITKDLMDKWRWKQSCAVFNCSYGEESDFLGVARRIKKLTGSSSALKIKRPLDYNRFYLDNSKLKKILNRFDYSFDRGLGNYLKKYKDWLIE